MKEMNVEDMWISLVRHNYSGSENTEDIYRRCLKEFCEFIEAKPNVIYEEWKNCESAKDVQNFVGKYKFLMIQYMNQLEKEGYAEGTIQGRVLNVKSFFKHLDMPFTNSIRPKNRVKYHNRKIKKAEIAKILKHSKYARDRAYYCMG